MILPNTVLRSKRWQRASNASRWAWYESQRLVQTILGRIPTTEELRAAGIQPTRELFDLKGDTWEPIGIPWDEVRRAFRAKRNFLSTGNSPVHREISSAPRNPQCTEENAEHWEFSSALGNSQCTEKSEFDDEIAQPSQSQEETRETEAATEPATACSPPLHPPIYIYNKKKKKECIGGGGEGGGGGARVWMSNSVFQTRDKGPRVLTEEEMRDLAQAHDITVLKRELPRASSWLLTNPRRRKASSGLLNFLRGWMERTVPPEGEKRPAAESWSANAKPEPKSWRVGL